MSLQPEENSPRNRPVLPPSRQAAFGLFLARFCTTAWFGAATLFVVVGVTEVTRGGFDVAVKDRLVAIRFPAFYLFGFTLISLGWIGAWLARGLHEFSRKRRAIVLFSLALAMVLMITDYVTIYRALLDMVQPPGSPKTAQFAQYHEASKWINLAGLFFVLVSVKMLSWPTRRIAKPA